jgi:hypothetical protein
MPGNWHVRFGKRRNETDRRKPTRRVAPTSPLAVRARDHRGLDGDRQATGDRRRTRGPERSGGWRRRDFVGSRGMGEPGSPRAFSRGAASPGEESRAAAIAARRSRPAVLWPDHAIKRPRGSPDSSQGEDVAGMGPCKRSRLPGERTETLAHRRAVARIRDQRQRSPPKRWTLSAAGSGAVRLKRCDGRVDHGEL